MQRILGGVAVDGKVSSPALHLVIGNPFQVPSEIDHGYKGAFGGASDADGKGTESHCPPVCKSFVSWPHLHRWFRVCQCKLHRSLQGTLPGQQPDTGASKVRNKDGKCW